MDKSALIERVRKLLAVTEEKGCTQAEAEQAFTRASRLMTEHNLDMSEVEDSDDGSQSWSQDDVYDTGRWTLESNLAYGIVSQHFFVEGFFARRCTPGGNDRKILRFFGRSDNVLTAKWAFNALKDAFDRLWNEYRNQTRCPASDRRIFVSGVASGFDQKLRDERKAMEIERDLVKSKSIGSTALAIVNLNQQTRVAFRDAKPNLFKANGDSKNSSIKITPADGSQSALTAGIQAGRNLNLNRAVGGSGRKSITS